MPVANLIGMRWFSQQPVGAPSPGWPSRSPTTRTVACARLGADVVRHNLIVVDFHHLLLAGVPAPSELMANAQGNTHH